jgi:Cytochrome P460
VRAVSGLASGARCGDTGAMNTKTIALTIGLMVLYSVATSGAAAAQANSPAYTADGNLLLPENYRDWVFLTSSFDMSYSAGMQMGHHMLDNVFVNPDSYKSFLATGTWPDKTVLVKENRKAPSEGSINKGGNYQSTEIESFEIHVKDEARFPGKWGFFAFGGKEPAKLIPQAASCYSCHAAHAAVDTTFVQFYPTLLSVAQAKGTLSKSYTQEIASSPLK